MLHAVSCYFNPAGYRRLRDNLHRFVASLHGCPLTVVELSFDGTFELDGSLQIRGDRARHTLWQKERLLNLAVERLPPEVDRVAWIDADIQFANPDWAAETHAALERLAVVQLFDAAHFLDQRHHVIRSGPSVVGQHNKGDKVWPGLAWAARRSVFPLLDMHILGGGDNLMWQAFAGRHHIKESQGAWWRRLMSPRWLRAYLLEGERMRRRVGGRVGRIAGDVFHYWHGSFENRRYVDRWQILRDHQFDPETDVAIDANGLLRWNSDKPALHAAVAGYFASRQEDG